MYYKFTLRIVNIETGLLEWSNEKEIRKVSGRGFVSFQKGYYENSAINVIIDDKFSINSIRKNLLAVFRF